MRARKLAGAIAAACALSACSFGSRIVASNDDLADYRAYRVARTDGVRLLRAKRYLERHPEGRWSDEVRAAFAKEEPAFYERAKATREFASEYLADLPNGPHATAALALLINYDRHVEDIATARLLRAALRTEAMLEAASAQRRAVGDAILNDVAAILDRRVYGASIDELPEAISRELLGHPPSTWGGKKTQRDRDLFFSLPVRTDSEEVQRESRAITLTLGLTVKDGVVTGARVEGSDLFLHWDEATNLRALDPTRPNDRSEAQFHAREILSGALESAFPRDHCGIPAAPGELIARRCDGWEAIVYAGAHEGDRDAIVVRIARQ